MALDILFLSTLVAIWIVLFYHVILTYGGYRHFSKTITTSDLDIELESYPMVSILIPAHNEEAVIGRTVDAMARLIYPKDRIEIVVINDNSSDRTGKILEGKCRAYPQLKVLTTDAKTGGRGKSNALNRGLAICTGEYVVVYDADNTPERRAVLYLVSTIVKNDTLGAVVGKFRTRNKNASWLTRFINIETLSFQWLSQAGRCHFFKLTTIPGTNFIIRRAILDEIGGWNVGALTEDTELTIRVYERGYVIYWLPHAVTWEQEPETLRVWIKQRTRWAIGNMWVVGHYFRNIGKLRKSRILADIVYFVFTYFIFFAAVIASDTIFLLGLFDVVHITIKGPFGIIWALAYVLFIAETYISLSLERGEGTLENLVLTGVMYFTYSQLWVFLIFKALFQMVKKSFSKDKEIRWYKTERSAG